MAKIVTINSEILASLKEYKINSQEAQLYLLGIYFNLNTEYISEKTRKQVNALGIVEREYRDNASNPHTIKWKYPLFNEEKSEAFVWIDGFMNSFARINPERKGTKSSVMARMKKFFAEHPEVRMEDVKKATEAYQRTVTDPQYLKSAHKFIMDGAGVSKVSLLEQWVETVREKGSNDARTSKIH